MQAVGTKATSPRSTFTKKLAQMKTAAGEEVYWAANMTPDMLVEFQVCRSNADSKGTTWSIANTDRVVNHLES